MRTLTFIALLFLAPIVSFAQEENNKISTFGSAPEKRMNIGLQGGYYLSEDLNNIKPGENISIDFNYMINGKISLGAHGNFGQNRYYDTLLSNNPTYKATLDSTNSDINTIHAGLTVRYLTPLSKKILFAATLGVTAYNKTLIYPMLVNVNNSIIEEYAEQTETFIAIPLKFNIQYIVSDSFDIGLGAGLYYKIGETFIGKYFGPQITYKF